MVALTIVMVAMTFIAGFRPNWRYGVVAAVALADTTGEIDVMKTRAIATGIGIIVGIVVSLIAWPESAGNCAARHRRQTLKAAADRYEWALKDEENKDWSDTACPKFHQSLSSCRTVASAARPSQKDRFHQTVDAVQELYNSVIFLNRVDSPLSQFDESIITRDDLIAAGRNAIEAQAEDNTDSQADDAFEDAIRKAEDRLSGRNLQSGDARGAACVTFALQEIQRCIDNVKDALSLDNGPSLADRTPSAVKEVLS